MTSLPCSDSSRLAREPVGGTAVGRTWRWIGIEYRPTWAAKAVASAELPTAARAWVDRVAAEPGTRVQLLRRPGLCDGPLTVQVADTAAGVLRSLRIDTHEDLAALDLAAILAGEVGEPVRGPVAWVCTHGQRDVCCARLGGRVFAALRQEIGEGAWQTSHLGGHRFAATLLWLPEGICYGRLRHTEVPALVEAAARDELFDLERIRGRVAWSRAAQAAEVALRHRLGERRLDAVELVSEAEDHVILRAGGTEHRLTISLEPLARPVVASCGKEPAPAAAIVAR